MPLHKKWVLGAGTTKQKWILRTWSCKKRVLETDVAQKRVLAWGLIY